MEEKKVGSCDREEEKIVCEIKEERQVRRSAKGKKGSCNEKTGQGKGREKRLLLVGIR